MSDIIIIFVLDLISNMVPPSVFSTIFVLSIQISAPLAEINDYDKKFFLTSELVKFKSPPDLT